MRALRGLAPDAPPPAIASGPGRLTAALGVSLDEYGASLLRGALSLRRPAPGDAPLAVASSHRTGLTRGAALPYRFFAAGHPCVSRAPRRAGS
jgi:DNA-3-methyladenine glycosylase